MRKCKNKTKQNRTEEMEWRNTEILGSLLYDYKYMRRGMQISNNTMESINKVWPQQRLYTNQKLKIYETILKSVLKYIYSTWGLRKTQIENFIEP